MRFDESSAECRVFTFKEGLLSPLGHDLELRVGRFTIDVSDDRRTVEAKLDAGSLRVAAARVDGRSEDVSARDRASIEKTIVDDVLHARKYPEILFCSISVEDREIRGTLTLHGRSREIRCAHEVAGARHTASVRLEQPQFGITPYRAMLGALRVRADLLVEVRLSIG
jgi:polyisoprenoid-binding protein YceI